MIRTAAMFSLAVLFAAGVPGARAATFETSAGTVRVDAVVTGLSEPWGLAFLPGGGFLVTERGGRLLLGDGAGVVREVAGLPQVRASGQGGLLDIMVPRDFAQSRVVFLTYAAPVEGRAGTALASARLSEDGSRLSGLRVLFQAPGDRGEHFGARVVEAPDGKLFLTLGERQQGAPAQDLSRPEGKVLRLNRDGTIPADNPLAGRQGVRAEIWSYGHRNPQGAALDASGQLWTTEHGARGGDEINRIEPGRNYGWPVISYGVNYNGSRIGEGTAKPGMEQPAHYWDPSIAPSGLVIHSGRMWPEWKGDFFTGSLNTDFISRLDPDRGFAEERIAGPETARVRDIREAPDGAIWFLSVGKGAIYRISR